MKLHKRTWYSLLLVLVLVGVLVAVTACGGGDEQQGSEIGGGEDAVQGGIFTVYINEPAFIDPVNLQESEGTQVGNQLFDSLAKFDYKTGDLLPAAAESWSANDDASVWTFKLKDAKFHDGTKVTAADFKYAWERICNPVNESEVSYHLAPVQGYQEMRDGTATELSGVKVINDKTLEVTLTAPFGDFEYVVAHPALAPVPKAAVEADPVAFGDMPIGNGPYKMVEPWAHNQYIRVERFDDYYGPKANADGVDFLIFTDEDTAFLAYQAGDLDFTSIPSGQVETLAATYGYSDDGLEIAPGKQVLIGAETAIYYILLNCEDEVIGNPLVRQAMSLAINRVAINDTVYEGLREPATGIVPWGIVGYTDNAWQYSKFDREAAKAKLAEAGYPNGEGFPTIKLSFNSGSGHEDVMALIQSDLKEIGITAEFDGVEWAQYLDKLGSGDFQIGRLGWIADYPIMDNFLYPLFLTGSGDNYSRYTNATVDSMLDEARTIADGDERVAKYQEIEKMVGDDCPVIPIVKYKHHHIGSDRVLGLVYSPQGLLNLEQAWIAKDAQ